MNETKYWTWHMLAGVVILVLLGVHMMVMHLGAGGQAVAPFGHDAVSMKNSLFRDGNLSFTLTYVLLLGVALYHGLYGLRTMLFELTLKPAAEKALTALLLIVGCGFFALGTWAAFAAHALATSGGKG
jgi:succinate dehydrogenase / fumarate reductase membrane anchor subunit